MERHRFLIHIFLGVVVGEMMVDWFGVGAWVWTAKNWVGRVVTLVALLGMLE